MAAPEPLSPDANPTPTLPPWMAAILATVLVAAVAFSLSFVPFRASQDDFWHLKAGMLQVEQGYPIHGPEPFSYCGPEETWHNHEWLAQRWFYRVFATADSGDLNGGLIRLLFFKSLIVSLTFVLVCWGVYRRGASWAVAALCGVVAAEISRRTIYVRPPIFSYLFLAGFLLLLHEWKAGRLRGRWLWVLPPVTVLWANLHGMVPLAFVAVGAYSAGEWIEALLQGGRRISFRERLRNLWLSPTVRLSTAVLVVTALATLAQPSGIGLYSLAGKFTKDPLLQTTIGEMLPAKFFLQPGAPGQGFHFVPGFASFWFALAAVGILWMVNRGRLQHWGDALLVLFFSYQAVSHWRLLPLFAIVAAGPLGWLLTTTVVPAIRTRLPRNLSVGRLAAALALLLAVTYTAGIREHHTFVQRNLMVLRGKAIENPMDYPVPLVRALLAVRPPGRLYSPSNYCGWFMWWLAPEVYRTFADNRFDHFGSQYLHDELVMRRTLRPGYMVAHREVKRSWQDTITHWAIKTLAIERSSMLHKRLRTYPGFRPAYIYVPPGSNSPDAGWTIWVTTADEGTTPAESLARRFQNENPGAPHPEVLENWKPDPNAPELKQPGE